MSNVLGPCGFMDRVKFSGWWVFTGIKGETFYSEITDSCASSLCPVEEFYMINCQKTWENETNVFTVSG